MALTDKLSAIGEAIRAKTGGTELLTLDEMPVAINSITTGGGSGADLPDEAFVITGDCSYRFGFNGWNWFIEEYADKITTKDISNPSFMFSGASNLTEIPFEINVKDGLHFNNMFNGARNLKDCPKIRGTIKANINLSFDAMLQGAMCIRDLEDLFTSDMLVNLPSIVVTSQFSCYKFMKFTQMYSLRTIPTWFKYFNISEDSTSYPYPNYSLYATLFQDAASLDEVVNLPVLNCTAATQTSNMFSDCVRNAHRLKNFTFETNEDGTAKAASWSGQTIDFTTVGSTFGYSSYESRMTNYNSGITADKEVYDDTTYQALKDDPDWYSTVGAYCRYNHDSAVATINSLPDCSATGTNTIKFKGTAGSSTDGGAINTLTEEEIAVATAKGWTVTLV